MDDEDAAKDLMMLVCKRAYDGRYIIHGFLAVAETDPMRSLSLAGQYLEWIHKAMTERTLKVGDVDFPAFAANRE